jgi:hypothetical protein
MKKLLVTLDDETASLLAKFPNKSGMMREATKLYLGHILTDTVDGMRASYLIVGRRLESMNDKIDKLDGKIDFIARKVQ